MVNIAKRVVIEGKINLDFTLSNEVLLDENTDIYCEVDTILNTDNILIDELTLKTRDGRWLTVNIPYAEVEVENVDIEDTKNEPLGCNGEMTPETQNDVQFYFRTNLS